jgi:lysozyme
MRIIKASSQCTDLIKRFEGLSLKPYLCPANVPTIGYGSTLYANGARVRMTDRPLSQQEANILLIHEVDKFAKIVDSMTRDDVSQNQFDALVSFCFNVGGGALKSSTLLRKVNANLNDATIRAEFLRWNRADGMILRGLTTRREAEANLYFS